MVEIRVHLDNHPQLQPKRSTRIDIENNLNITHVDIHLPTYCYYEKAQNTGSIPIYKKKHYHLWIEIVFG